MTTEARSLAHPVSPATDERRVTRFNRTERAVHWTQATTFLLLLLTGLALQLPAIESLIGQRALLREIHLSAAFFFAFGPSIIAFSADRRSMGRDVDAVDSWDRDDLRWLIPFPLLRIFGVTTPPQGRFNAGQKLNAIFIAWSTLAFTITGLIMWQNRRFDIALVGRANTIHTSLAYIALAAFLGHLYLAVGYPKTRHALHAITGGWVRADWARHHHPKWLEGMTTPAPAPAFDGLRTGVQVLLGAYFCLFLVRVYFIHLGANVTDGVTSWLYDATALPGTAGLHPQTGVHLTDWAGIVYGVACLIAWLAVDRLRRLPAPTERSLLSQGQPLQQR